MQQQVFPGIGTSFARIIFKRSSVLIARHDPVIDRAKQIMYVDPLSLAVNYGDLLLVVRDTKQQTRRLALVTCSSSKTYRHLCPAVFRMSSFDQVKMSGGKLDLEFS